MIETIGDGIISEIKPCGEKLPCEILRDSAPKLLEALERILFIGISDETLSQARAAIATAKGEKS